MPWANISYIVPTNIFTHTRKAYHKPDGSPSAEEKWKSRQRLDGRSLSKVATGGQISQAVPSSFWFGAFSLTVSLSQLVNYWFETITIWTPFLAVKSKWLYLLSLMLLTARLVAWQVGDTTIFVFLTFLHLYNSLETTLKLWKCVCCSDATTLFIIF